MNIRKKIAGCFFAVCVGLGLSAAHAQVMVTFDFASAAGDEATSNANFVATGIVNPVTISRGSGLTATPNGGRFNAQGWGEASAADALANGDYFEWTVTPSPGSSVSITQIAFQVQRSNTGASNLVLRTSADGYAADLNALSNFAGNNATVPSTFNASGVSGLQNFATPVTFRVLGWTGVSGGSLGFEGTGNDIQLTGSVSSGPPPPPSTNVQFVGSSASVGEAVGTYDITIVKTVDSGNVTGQVQLGGTATVGDDFTVSATNFALNGATTSATITVSIVDDGALESSETVVLSLVNVVGGGTGTPSMFTLTITDNDSPPSPLFISEVADPLDNFDARFVELFNSSGSSIDLGAGVFYLARQVNGGSFGTVALTGTVAAGSTYVVAYSGTVFAAAYPLASPPNQNSTVISGNGDDGYFLYVGGSIGTGTLVDAYGVPDVDGSGQPWEYTDTRAVRTSTVTQANATWTASEWIIPATANVADMTPGVHPDGPVVISTNVSFTASAASVSESVGTYVVTVKKSIAVGDVSGQVALSGTATEGGPNDFTIDTTNFTMNGATTSATFTVTINDDVGVEAAETIILTLANVAGGTVVSPSVFTLTINANDTPPPDGAIAYYTFTGSNVSPEFVAANANATTVSVTAGSIAFSTANAATWTNASGIPQIRGSAGWTASDQATAKAFVMTVTADSGYVMTITNVSFYYRASAAGPTAIGFSLDGTSIIGGDATSNATTFLSQSVTGYDDVGSAVLSIQGWTNGWRASSGGGTLDIDDILIQGFLTLEGGGGTTIDDFDVTGVTLTPTLVSVTVAVTSNGVPYSLLYTTNMMTAPVPTGTADTEVATGGPVTLQDSSTTETQKFYWIRTND